MEKCIVRLMTTLMLACLAWVAGAQQRTLSGNVVSKDGSGIAGVSVAIKGSSEGTVTNGEGNFSLQTSARSGTLVFSSVGLKTLEVPLTNSSVYQVTMETSTYSIGEVVAIGYGTVKKSDLTGSVASIKGDQVSEFPTTNLAQALQGRATGVLVQQNTGAPGATMQIRIRGTNSIMGSNEPLWIIDGFPGDPSMINNDDVESIEILKDASATAIYGSRGANGVVLVTTRHGKAGKTRIEYDGSYSIQTLRKKLDLMNAKEYAEFYNIYYLNDNGSEYFSKDDIAGLGKGTDWQDLLFRSAPVNQHNLNISGGNDKTQFSIGAGFFDQQGIIVNSGYRRIDLSANINHKISDKLEVSYNVILSRRDNNPKNSGGGNRGGSLISAILSAPPTVTPYNDDGTYRMLTTVYPFSSNSIINPLAYVNEVSGKSFSNNVMTNAALIYRPIEGLSIKISGNLSNADSRSDNYTTLKYPGSQGSASISIDQNLQVNSDNIITYTKAIGDHQLTAMGGFTYEKATSKGVGASGTGFLSDIYQTYNIGSAATPGTPSSYYSAWTLLSYLGRLNYSYKNKYLVTASIRTDGSSRYGKGNKWGYFPSGAVAWHVSEEAFMKNSAAISDLKIRAGYGKTGSTAISPYYTLDILSSGKTVFGNDLYTYFSPGTRLPGDLKWETTDQTDFGIDMGLFDNRLRMTADYYIKKTTDLLNNVQLPSSLGYTTTVKNIGAISNKGFELQIDGDILTHAVKWSAGGSFSMNRNKVLKLYEGQDIVGLTSNGLTVVIDNYNLIREGKPLGVFYGYQVSGYDENGFFTYKDHDGVDGITAADKTFIGNPNPDFIYSVTSNVSWKHFSLNFFLQGVQGNDIFSFSMINQTLDYGYGLNTLREILEDHWTKETPNAKYPKISKHTSTLMSDRFVYDGSYLRLKNIQLTYDLPVGRMGITWLKSGQVYVSGQNLLTITKYPWWDPEINSYGGSNSINQGIDWYSYPTAKGVTFGVKLTF